MVNIIVNSDPRYPIDKHVIQSTALEVLQRYKVNGRIEMGITVIGDRKMHQINKDFRGLDETTNILTFALEDPMPQVTHIRGVGFVSSPDNVLRLGDIVISYPQVIEDARFDGVSVDEEMRVLVEHGIKHLLGYHHD